MLIDCPHCTSKVKGVERGSATHHDPEEDPFPYKIAILRCPGCKNLLVGIADLVPGPDGEDIEDTAHRIWPSPRRTLRWDAPDLVRQSLDEAERCYAAGAYSACAVMSGRAIEALCQAKGARSQNLAGGLRELLDSGVIDQRLFDWAHELRVLRNAGAHATDVRVTKDDAIDVRDFAFSICDYVFTLAKRFDDFKTRQARKSDIGARP